MSLPEELLRDHLVDAGLLGPTWTTKLSAIAGRAEPRPVVQLRRLREQDVDGDRRILMIRTLPGGGGDYRVATQQAVIVVLSKAADTDDYFARDYAEQVQDWIRRNNAKECLINIELIGGVNGPYEMASGRLAYELNLTLSIDTQVTGG